MVEGHSKAVEHLQAALEALGAPAEGSEVERAARAILEAVLRLAAELAVPEHLKRQPVLKYLSEAQVAERLRCSKHQLSAIRRRGGGPTFIRNGRTVLYVTQSLLDWEETLPVATLLLFRPCRRERTRVAYVVPGGRDPAVGVLDAGDAELVDMAVEGIGEFRLRAARLGEPKKAGSGFPIGKIGRGSCRDVWSGRQEGQMNKEAPDLDMGEVSPARELRPEEIAAAMDGVLRPHETEPDRIEAFLPSPCVQNHAANLAFLADGSLACVWFGGTMEGMGDISIWMSRLPAGAGRWGQAIRLTDDPERSEQNPILFPAPDGTVRLFHTAQPGGRQEECEIRYRTSLDGGASFGRSERLGDFGGVFVRQPLHDGPGGEWLLPGFRCVALPGRLWTGAEDTAVMLVSADRGATWNAHEVPESVGAVHMNPVKAGSGPMVAFYRNRFATSVLRSLSHDGGLTWSKPEPTPLPSNNSSIQAIRRRDGRIAMVLNPVNAAVSSERRASLYDEIEGDGGPSGTGGAIWGVPRAPLSLVLSADDGASFPERRDLETGSGYCLTNNSVIGLNREYSYPSIVEGPDGSLRIAYTYHRRAIKYVCLRWD